MMAGAKGPFRGYPTVIRVHTLYKQLSTQANSLIINYNRGLIGGTSIRLFRYSLSSLQSQHYNTSRNHRFTLFLNLQDRISTESQKVTTFCNSPFLIGKLNFYLMISNGYFAIRNL